MIRTPLFAALLTATCALLSHSTAHAQSFFDPRTWFAPPPYAMGYSPAYGYAPVRAPQPYGGNCANGLCGVPQRTCYPPVGNCAHCGCAHGACRPRSCPNGMCGTLPPNAGYPRSAPLYAPQPYLGPTGRAFDAAPTVTRKPATARPRPTDVEDDWTITSGPRTRPAFESPRDPFYP